MLEPFRNEIEKNNLQQLLAHQIKKVFFKCYFVLVRNTVKNALIIMMSEVKICPPMFFVFLN
ncbi:hypothetical protein CSC79_11795 [Pseudoalteromonas sp. 3D05]|nr:hypothetical protein CSC79_11795 [Pseudoalteromonas sp. 3D05]